MINVALKDEKTIVVTFEYNPTLVDLVKTIPARRWNKEKKCWEIPFSQDAMSHIKDSFPTAKFSEDLQRKVININERQLRFKDIKNLKFNSKTISFGKYKFKTKPYRHQKVMMKMGIEFNNIAFFCEMGTGKTKACLDVISYRKMKDHVKKALIIAPNTVLSTWGREIEKHSDLTYNILQGSKQKRLELLAEDKGLHVINYEGLRIIEKELIKKDFDLIAADESQRIKNHKAQQSKSAHRIAAACKYHILMSGTPVVQNPLDIFSQFLFLDGGETFGKSFFAHRNRYFYDAGRYFPDWRPRPESLAKLNKKIYQNAVRFTKNECLDLPEKIYQVREVEMTTEQMGHYKDMKKHLLIETEPGKVVTAKIILEKMLRLSQITSGFLKYENGYIDDIKPNPKSAELKEILSEIMYNGKKAVIFCLYHHDINKLAQELEKYSPALLYGLIPTKLREEQIDRFQNDPSCKVLIGHPKTSGLGINLTAADTVIYYSQSFSLGDRLQSEDRCHRIGQHSPVTYIDLVCKNSIDEYIREALIKKKDIADVVVEMRELLRG